MSYAVPVTRPDPGATPELSAREKLRLLWGYVRPHRRILLTGMALGLVGTAAELATPMVTKAVLDGLAVDASLRGPVTVLAVLLVAGTAIGLIEGHPPGHAGRADHPRHAHGDGPAPAAGPGG